MTEEKKDQCEQQFEECMDNKVERHQAYHLLWIWGLILFLSSACVWIAPIFFPLDELVLSRALILRIPSDLMNAGLLMSVLVVFDLLTPGDSLKKATSEPISSAMVLSALLLSLAIIMFSY
jgi:hypothetical protein